MSSSYEKLIYVITDGRAQNISKNVEGILVFV